MHWAVTWHMSHEECRPQVARVWGQLIWCIQILILSRYHSQLLTTFNQTVNKLIILTHAIRDLFIYYYCRAYTYILQGTASCISWVSSTRVHHWVMTFYIFWLFKMYIFIIIWHEEKRETHNQSTRLRYQPCTHCGVLTMTHVKSSLLLIQLWPDNAFFYLACPLSAFWLRDLKTSRVRLSLNY